MGESTRAGRCGLVVVADLVVAGLVWGLTVAVRTATGVDVTGRSGLPVAGWLGAIGGGMVYGLVVGLVCAAPVVVVAALAGHRLAARPRTARVVGAVVGVVAVAVGALGLAVMLPLPAVVVAVSWPAAVVAGIGGAWWAPWVVGAR